MIVVGELAKVCFCAYLSKSGSVDSKCGMIARLKGFPSHPRSASQVDRITYSGYQSEKRLSGRLLIGWAMATTASRFVQFYKD